MNSDAEALVQWLWFDSE